MIAAVLLLSQQKSLLQERIPQPTGNNGYEEFLRAADMIAKSEALGKAYNAMTARPEKGEVLELRRQGLIKLQPVLALLRAGGAKPILFPPRAPAQDMEDLIGFQEVSAFRQLARILMTSAYVLLADGQSGAATTDLIACYRMMDVIAHNGTQIEAFTTTGTHAQIFALLERSFDAFAPADLARLEEMANDAVERPFWGDVVKGEADRLTDLLSLMAKEWDASIKKGEKDDPDDPGAKLLRKMTPAERATLFKRAKAHLDQGAANLALVGARPEREWIPYAKEGEEMNELESPKNSAQLDSLLADMATVRMIGAVNFAVVRTKWRLVRLTARLRRIMAERDAVPKGLPDDLPAGYADDGLAAGRFVFRAYTTGFSVESPGVTETGVVTLTSRLPRMEERQAP
ncbi:hypothetical protein EON79_06390 [bacterium]|nr:MAG: hypothetical protein EON79_06390 [bacterium]